VTSTTRRFDGVRLKSGVFIASAPMAESIVSFRLFALRWTTLKNNLNNLIESESSLNVYQTEIVLHSALSTNLNGDASECLKGDVFDGSDTTGEFSISSRLVWSGL